MIGAILGMVLGTLYSLFLRLVNFRTTRVQITARLGSTSVRGTWIGPALGLPRHIVAITFGGRVYYRGERTSSLIAHESTHLVQYRRFGWWGFLAHYGAQIVVFGYKDAPLEVAAQQAAYRAQNTSANS